MVADVDDATATDEQVRKAIPKFKNILEIIRPDRYGDWDAFTLGKRIEREVSGRLPQEVRELIFETGVDVSGDLALWIWVEMADEAVDEKELFRRFESARKELSAAAVRVCPDRWPFIHLRLTSERLAFEEGERKKNEKRKNKHKDKTINR